MLTSELTLVTGVSGFLGLHVAKAAADAGLRVRGTVRNLTHHKVSVEAVVPGIELFELDLVEATQEDWVAAAKDCAYCCHVASPFPIVAPSDENELIRPAVEGTKKVLAACRAAGVRRVVVTSSVASVSSGLEESGRDSFSKEDWSAVDKCKPYPKSKTLAERAAREFAAEHASEVSTVNPSYIQGPVLRARVASSTKMCERLLSGDMPAVPAVGLNICDVRDVAEVHIKALTAAPGGRYIVDSGGSLMTDVADMLAKEFPSYPVKTVKAPWLLLKLVSLWDKEAAAAMGNWKKKTKYDASDTVELLGRDLRTSDEAILAMARSLDEGGLAKGKRVRSRCC